MKNDKAITTMTEQEMSKHFIKSGFFSDAESESQAIVKILAGREVGLQPIEAMTGINIIKGKISLGANAMAAAVKKHPRYNYQVMEHTEEVCKIDFYEHDTKIGDSSFTIEEAKNIGIASTNPSWKKYPKAMLFARAISAGVRYHCPDVFGHAPVYNPEEMGEEVDSEGDLIDITPKPEEAYMCRNGCGKEQKDCLCELSMPNSPEDGTSVLDAGTLISPSRIDGAVNVFDAMDKIQSHAMKMEMPEVNLVFMKHCEAWANDEIDDVNDIPFDEAVKIVKELTGFEYED